MGLQRIDEGSPRNILAKARSFAFRDCEGAPFAAEMFRVAHDEDIHTTPPARIRPDQDHAFTVLGHSPRENLPRPSRITATSSLRHRRRLVEQYRFKTAECPGRRTQSTKATQPRAPERADRGGELDRHGHSHRDADLAKHPSRPCKSCADRRDKAETSNTMWCREIEAAVAAAVDGVVCSYLHSSHWRGTCSCLVDYLCSCLNWTSCVHC